MGWSGFASFVLPGLGQLIDGETGRGLAIIGGDVVLGTTHGVPALFARKSKNNLHFPFFAVTLHSQSAVVVKW